MALELHNRDGTTTVVGRVPRAGGGYETGAIGTRTETGGRIQNRVPGSVLPGQTITQAKQEQAIAALKEAQQKSAVIPSKPLNPGFSEQTVSSQNPDFIASTRRGEYITLSGGRAVPIASYQSTPIASGEDAVGGITYSIREPPTSTAQTPTVGKKDYAEGILYPKDIKGTYDQELETYRSNVAQKAYPVAGTGGLFDPKGKYTYQQLGYKLTVGIPETLILTKGGLRSAAYLGSAAVRGEPVGKELVSSTQQVPSTLQQTFTLRTVEGRSNVAALGAGVLIGVSALKAQNPSSVATGSQKPSTSIGFKGETEQLSFKPDTLNVARINAEQTGTIKGGTSSDVILGRYNTRQISSVGRTDTLAGSGETATSSLRYTVEPAGRVGKLLLGPEAVKTTYVGSQKALVPFESSTSTGVTSTKGTVLVQPGRSPFISERYFANPARAEAFYTSELSNIVPGGKVGSYSLISRTTDSPVLGELTDVKIGGTVVGRGVSSSKLVSSVESSAFDSVAYTSDVGGFNYKISSGSSVKPSSVGSRGRGFGPFVGKKGSADSGIASRDSLFGDDVFGQRFLPDEPTPIVSPARDSVVVPAARSLRSSVPSTVSPGLFFNRAPVSITPGFIPVIPPSVRLSSPTAARQSSSIFSARSTPEQLSNFSPIVTSKGLSVPEVPVLTDYDSYSRSVASSSSGAASESGATTSIIPTVIFPGVPPSRGLIGKGFSAPVFGGSSGGGFGGFLRRFRKRESYAPSLTASAFDISGSGKQRSGGYTGLEVRPLSGSNNRKKYIKRGLL